MGNYEENKLSFQKIIRRMKAIDPERGLYFEKHMVFNDEKQAIQYTGNQSFLAKLLMDAKVF